MSTIKKILEQIVPAHSRGITKFKRRRKYKKTGEDPKKAGVKRGIEQAEHTKTKGLFVGARLIQMTDPSSSLTDHVKKIKRRFGKNTTGLSRSASSVFLYHDRIGGRRIVLGNPNMSGVPDLRIFKGGSKTPTSTVEIASGANKMWADYSPSFTKTGGLIIPPDSVMGRLQRNSIISSNDMRKLGKILQGKVKNRFGHNDTIRPDNRHSVFAEVEKHLRSKGVSHIIVGDRVFSTSHARLPNGQEPRNLSHYVHRTHFTTSGNRVALRIGSLRDPSTGKKFKGNEGDYHVSIATNKLGHDLSSLL